MRPDALAPDGRTAVVATPSERGKKYEPTVRADACATTVRPPGAEGSVASAQAHNGLRIARGPHRMEAVMSTTMWILLIVVLFVMFGGGGGYYWSRGRR